MSGPGHETSAPRPLRRLPSPPTQPALDPDHARPRPHDTGPMAGADTWHAASIAAECLVRRVWARELSRRAMSLPIRWARRGCPLAVARCSAAVSRGSPAEIRASTLSMRVSTLVARAHLMWTAGAGDGVAAPAAPAAPRDRVPTATMAAATFRPEGIVLPIGATSLTFRYLPAHSLYGRSGCGKGEGGVMNP